MLLKPTLMELIAEISDINARNIPPAPSKLYTIATRALKTLNSETDLNKWAGKIQQELKDAHE